MLASLYLKILKITDDLKGTLFQFISKYLIVPDNLVIMIIKIIFNI